MSVRVERSPRPAGTTLRRGADVGRAGPVADVSYPRERLHRAPRFGAVASDHAFHAGALHPQVPDTARRRRAAAARDSREALRLPLRRPRARSRRRRRQTRRAAHDPPGHPRPVARMDDINRRAAQSLAHRAAAGKRTTRSVDGGRERRAPRVGAPLPHERRRTRRRRSKQASRPGFPPPSIRSTPGNSVRTGSPRTRRSPR